MAVPGILLPEPGNQNKYKAKNGICVMMGHSRKEHWMSWKTTTGKYNGSIQRWVCPTHTHHLPRRMRPVPCLRGCQPGWPLRDVLRRKRFTAPPRRARRRSVGGGHVDIKSEEARVGEGNLTIFFHLAMFFPSRTDFVPFFLSGNVGQLRVPSVACNHARHTRVCK